MTKNLCLHLFLSSLTMALFCLTGLCYGGDTKAKEPHLFGTLQCDPAKASQMNEAGITVSTLSVAWNQYEPLEGKFNAAYIGKVAEKLALFRKAGMLVVLDFGLQYPPAWVFEYPHSRFVNQYGDAYNEDKKSGTNGVNAVFNKTLRAKQKAFIAKVFEALGTDFYAVRLGWGYYGELCYPLPKFNGKSTCFWAYDDIAQGKAEGLPAGMKPCPVPGWVPGSSGKGEGHADARAFVEWYMSCLQNYHDWQLSSTRELYKGPLIMMYPSWGLRPGQIEDAVKGDLANANGEITRGYDFKRLVDGIKDPDVIVYTTWLDSNPTFGDDESPDQKRWSPARYLSFLAGAHKPRLRFWGENTGSGDLKAMQLCFERMRKFDMMGVVWAFEPELFSGKHATFKQFAELVGSGESH
ncbi:MAG: beta-galactosidase [Planctomycetes bacterium]|nr:beta-galactosidase [Planctomycetota bacterium]